MIDKSIVDDDTGFLHAIKTHKEASSGLAVLLVIGGALELLTYIDQRQTKTEKPKIQTGLELRTEYFNENSTKDKSYVIDRQRAQIVDRKKIYDY